MPVIRAEFGLVDGAALEELQDEHEPHDPSAASCTMEEPMAGDFAGPDFTCSSVILMS